MEIKIVNEVVKEKVATIILSFLRKEKVFHIFGIPGGYTFGISNELHEFPDIKFVQCQHEQGATFMADGYARASKNIGVVLVTAGPGLSNTFTGIISAFADGIPILLISGAIPKDKMFKGAVQDTESFRVDISAAFKETTAFQANITYKDNFLQYFRNAIRYLFKGKVGPVHLNISSDIFSQEVEHRYEYYKLYKDSYISYQAADRAFDEILTARSAIIMVGYGVVQSKAQEQVEELAELLKIPVVTTPKGKSAFNNESKYYLGIFGAGSNMIPVEYLKNEEVDLVIAIGTTFNEFSSSAWSNYLGAVDKIVQIDINPYIIGRTYANTYGVTGDAKITLEYLLTKFKNLGPEKISHLNAELITYKYKLVLDNVLNADLCSSEATPVKVPRLLKDFHESFSPYQVNVFNDNGSCIFWIGHYLKLRKNWEYFISLGYASMGYAIPAAIGGALATPEKINVAFAGDGSAMMHGNELKTAAEYKAPVFIFVFNDGRLGIIHHSSSILYGKPIPGTAHDERIDFVKLANSLGMDGYRIDSPGQINPGFIDRLVKEKKPVLFDCWIDAEDLAPYAERITQVKK